MHWSSRTSCSLQLPVGAFSLLRQNLLRVRDQELVRANRIRCPMHYAFRILRYGDHQQASLPIFCLLHLCEQKPRDRHSYWACWPSVQRRFSLFHAYFLGVFPLSGHGCSVAFRRAQGWSSSCMRDFLKLNHTRALFSLRAEFPFDKPVNVNGLKISGQLIVVRIRCRNEATCVHVIDVVVFASRRHLSPFVPRSAACGRPPARYGDRQRWTQMIDVLVSFVIALGFILSDRHLLLSVDVLVQHFEAPKSANAVSGYHGLDLSALAWLYAKKRGRSTVVHWEGTKSKPSTLLLKMRLSNSLLPFAGQSFSVWPFCRHHWSLKCWEQITYIPFFSMIFLSKNSWSCLFFIRRKEARINLLAITTPEPRSLLHPGSLPGKRPVCIMHVPVS